MSKVESGFIPLPKVEREQPSEYAEIRLNLPSFVDQDRIGVNVSRIDSLSRLSGFKTLAILGKTGQETSETMPNVVGIGSDGSAVASKSVAKLAVPVFDSKSQTAYDLKNQRRVDVTIGINIDELAQINREQGSEARSPQVYITETDKSVRTGIRKEGTNNLIGKHTLNSWDILSDIFYPLNTAFLITDILSQTWKFLPIDVASIGLLTWVRLSRWKLADGRLSFFAGPQLDRATLLQIRTRTQKLVADLHPDKK